MTDRSTILWTLVALHDLDQLSPRLHSESPFGAEQILDRIIGRVDSLATMSSRGREPRELASNTSGWLEMVEAPWRILYRVVDHTVEIHGIFDGRRDLRQILIDRAFRQGLRTP